MLDTRVTLFLGSVRRQALVLRNLVVDGTFSYFLFFLMISSYASFFCLLFFSFLFLLRFLQEGKGWRCGPVNQIVDDLDFKPSELDRQFWSDTDSNDQIVLSIVISI